jgi:hypothetical protein
MSHDHPPGCWMAGFWDFFLWAGSVWASEAGVKKAIRYALCVLLSHMACYLKKACCLRWLAVSHAHWFAVSYAYTAFLDISHTTCCHWLAVSYAHMTCCDSSRVQTTLPDQQRLNSCQLKIGKVWPHPVFWIVLPKEASHQFAYFMHEHSATRFLLSRFYVSMCKY